MITSEQFKRHISKSLSEKLKKLGFKGSGFNYKKESKDFFFVIGIQANLSGGSCCVELGIQPKEITENFGHTIDFKKLKHYDCEFRMRLTKILNKKWWNFSNKKVDNQWWEYSNSEKENIKTTKSIFESIKTQAIPIIASFENENYILDNLNKDDLTNPENKIGGLNLIGTETRLIWALSKIYEKRNLQKALEYAKLGLLKLDKNDKFLGKEDFENIINNYS